MIIILKWKRRCSEIFGPPKTNISRYSFLGDQIYHDIPSGGNKYFNRFVPSYTFSLKTCNELKQLFLPCIFRTINFVLFESPDNGLSESETGNSTIKKIHGVMVDQIFREDRIFRDTGLLVFIVVREK